MADIIPSLFGLTPESYGQQQQMGYLNRGVQLAQLDPAARGAAMTYSGAAGLGNAIGGLLGAEDPQLKLISNRNNIIKQVDQTNPESMLKGAQMLAQIGDNQGAFALADYARKAQSEKALAQQRMAEKMTPEQRNAMAYASSVADPGTPQFNQIYQTTLQGLISKEKPEATSGEMKNANAIALLEGPQGSPAYNAKYASELQRLTTKAEGRPLIKEIGVAEGSREPVYTYQEGNAAPQQIIYKTVNGQQTMIPYTGGVDRTTAKTQVSVSQKGEEAFVTELGKLDAKKVNEAFTTRENATSAINSLNKLAQLPDSELITGQFASGRVGATNLLTTLGLASSTDANKLATSQEYQKVAGDVILQTLGGKLGSGFSNADREFIASLVPQLETNPAARRKLISFMQNKNQDIVKETIRLESYARQNKGLTGFEPKIPMSVAPSQPRPYSGLSDAELNAKIRAAQAQQPQ
jgi:hypothetical protein